MASADNNNSHGQEWLGHRDFEKFAMYALQGRWELKNYSAIVRAVVDVGVPGLKQIQIDASQLQEFDTAGALALHSLIEKCGKERVELVGFSRQQRAVLDIVRERFEKGVIKDRDARFPVIVAIGAKAVTFWRESIATVSFLGEIIVAVLVGLLRPRRIRLKELFVQLEQVFLNSIPVIALVTALIGVVVAYLFAVQIEKYGANIFIVDGVAMAIGREISPLIVAVVMAGRSGSAFTAQIGTMKLTQEIDAMRIMGLAPMRVLILPRVFALLLAMPLLVVLGDVVGVLGGVLISDLHLDISPATFLDRLRSVVPVKHFVVGLVKAPLFAFSIALIGCRMGLTVRDSARSVGLNTTSTVVQSIVAVILIDAACAVIFMELGY